MLFRYRPPQTWMPYSLPRGRTQQAAYNRELQDHYDATRRVPPPVPAPEPDRFAQLRELGELHRTGVLTDAEFEAQKARVLET